jgi:A/G-specific adenine glycosylase
MKRLTEFDDLADPTFSQAVIDWQRTHGRHTLPWQNTRDAYRVWLSEIMLQQTQVAAVLGYYARFLERFPTVHDLAAAPIEDVMAHWSGLGYYTRARNLHACAVRVVAEYGGVFPADPALLADLPGIGRSTAAAITAFSNGTRAAILDGNVKRVFARVFGVEGYPGEKRIEDALWRRAEALLPGRGHRVVYAGPDGPGRDAVHALETRLPALPAAGALRGLRHRPHRGTAGAQTEEDDAGKARRHAGRDARWPGAARAAAGERDLGRLLSLPEVDGHVGIETRIAMASIALAARLPRFGRGRGSAGAAAAGARVHALQAAHGTRTR